MRRAFTFIEVMAVVLLMGLLAAATAWSMAGQVKQGSRQGAVQQVVQAERSARLAALRTGQVTVLRIDLDRGELRRMTVVEGELKAGGHAVRLTGGRGVRLDKVILPGESQWLEEETGKRRIKAVRSGVVEVRYSTQGRSETFAVRVGWVGDEKKEEAGEGAEVFRGDGVWVVFVGVTGQVILIHDEQEVQNLLEWVETGGVVAG